MIATVSAATGAHAQPPIAFVESDRPSRPAYSPLRAEEDWGPLRDSSLRNRGADRLKALPLGQNSYLSFGADVRFIGERYGAEDFGKTSKGLDHSLIQRYMVHADLRSTTSSGESSWRVFVQLKSGVVADRIGKDRVPDTDTLDAHQLFVEASRTVSSGRSATVRLGRQEISYGTQRLIGIRDFPNVRQSFDLARVNLRGAGVRPWRLDLFGGAPARTLPGVFDDATDRSRTVWGAYAFTPPLNGSGNAELYYVGHNRVRGVFHRGAGREVRHTIGARASGRSQFDVATADFEVEPMLQAGRFDRGALLAWYMGADVGLRMSKVKGRPRISIGVEAASGDQQSDSKTLRAFHPLYARASYIGLGGPLGAVNFVSLHPKLETALPGGVVFSADWFPYWRQSTQDGVYSIIGTPLGAVGDSKERFVGHRPGLHLDYAAGAQATVGIRVTRFMAGPYLRAIGWTKNSDYATITVAYRY